VSRPRWCTIVFLTSTGCQLNDISVCCEVSLGLVQDVIGIDGFGEITLINVAVSGLWWYAPFSFRIRLSHLRVCRLRFRQLFHSGRGTGHVVWVSAVRGAWSVRRQKIYRTSHWRLGMSSSSYCFYCCSCWRSSVKGSWALNVMTWTYVSGVRRQPSC